MTAPEFFGIEVGQPFDLVVPLGIDPLIRGPRVSLHNPASMMLTVMLRLETDQTLDAATAQLRGMQPAILSAVGFPGGKIPSYMKEPFVLVPAATGTSDRSGLRRQYQRPLLTILAVVALVLLVACGNIANLLLARATARKHELSVRLALGAPRWRLAQQLLTESAVLAAAGTIAGVVFAMWASRALVTRLSNPDSPISLDLSLDWRVLGFTAAVGVLTTMVFGIRPAFRATRGAPIDALKNPVRTGGERLGVSSALIVAQVALSLLLLVTAALLVRTFTRLAGTPLGFDSERVLVIAVDTARAQPESSRRTRESSTSSCSSIGSPRRLVWRTPPARRSRRSGPAATRRSTRTPRPCCSTGSHPGGCPSTACRSAPAAISPGTIAQPRRAS